MFKPRSLAVTAFIAASLLLPVPSRADDPLPPSLDALFPPAAPAPLYLHAKLEMAAALSGIMVDLTERDVSSIAAGYGTFQDRYAKVRAMVPEWTEQFPLEPVRELGAALDSGDPGSVGKAMGRLGAVCSDCHTRTMARVQARYHWPRFDALSVEDPPSHETVGFADFMHRLDAGLVGIPHSMKQGQLENARRSHAALSARLDALADACQACHESERHYFVDASVRTLVADMGRELAKDTPDGAVLARLGQQVGQESCHKCHLVHVPAAMEQMRVASGRPSR